MQQGGATAMLQPGNLCIDSPAQSIWVIICRREEYMATFKAAGSEYIGNHLPRKRLMAFSSFLRRLWYLWLRTGIRRSVQGFPAITSFKTQAATRFQLQPIHPPRSAISLFPGVVAQRNWASRGFYQDPRGH